MSHSPVPAPQGNPRRPRRAAWVTLGAGAVLTLSLTVSSSCSSTENESHSPHCVNVLSVDSTCPSAPNTPTPTPTHSGGGSGKRPKPHPVQPLHQPQEIGVPAQIRRSGSAIVYGSPSKEGGVKYELDRGHPVTIVCQQWGEVVKSPRDGKSSALWDKLGDAQFVPDAMVDTNSDSPVTRSCDGSW
ncbi:hypothetical protein ACWDBD_36925 [Streptomyces sp. NPDC001118]